MADSYVSAAVSGAVYFVERKKTCAPQLTKMAGTMN